MKVQITKIETYSFDTIYYFFREYLEEIDFWVWMENKKTILLKPNLLGAFPLEKAVTTHPVVIEAIAKLLLEHDKIVWIGDSPGGTVSVEKTWRMSGVEAIAKKYPVILKNFNSDGLIELKGKYDSYYIAESFINADAVINIAKYKTHGLTLFTGAVKNLYGLIPGLKKASYHKKKPRPEDFVKIITDLYNLTKNKIVLNIVDGIWGMEGEGPSAGNPRNFGVLFCSKSASALDYIASSMMGFESDEIPLVNRALDIDNLNKKDVSIPDEFRGFLFKKVDIKSVRRKSKFVNSLPPFIKKIFKRFFDYYPAFKTNCKRCKICVKACPVDAMILGSTDKVPKIDLKKCIRCLCCHEMCPHHAVYIKKSLIARLFMK